MRMKTMKTPKSSGLLARVSRLLIFTVLFSFFMHQGWYEPSQASAAISTLAPWSNIHNATTAPGTLSYTMTGPGLGARMLIVAVSGTMTTASATRTITLTYGGQTMTKQVTNETTSARSHTWLFYLKEAQIQAASNSNLVFTITNGGTSRFYQVDAAVFDGVDQSATPITNSQSWLNDGVASATIGPLPALTIAAGDSAVEIVSVLRYASTTARTLSTWAANWSSAFGPTNLASTDSVNVYIGSDTTAGSTTSSHTASGTSNGSMAAMSIKMLPMNLAVTDGTNPANANAGQGTVNNPLDAFTMAASAGGVTVNTLTLTGSVNFTTANIAGINIYRDNGTIGALDGADVLVPSSYSAITANATTITFTTPETVSTIENFLVVVDIAAAATTAQTFTGRITAATGTIGTPTYNDTSSATLTIQSAPGLTVGNGTNPANSDAQTTSMNNALDGFTLVTANALGGTAAVDTLTVTGSANFTAANIADVHVYQDNAPVGTFDVSDVLIPSTSSLIAGNVTTLTLSPMPISVTNTAANYLLVADITAGATAMQTFTGRVTAATGHGLATPTYNDTNSATLTIKMSSTITSCGSCHGYPPLDGTRSGTTGSVVGDHNAHVNKGGVACSVCHVAPAETSSNYGHRTGTIQMQASITTGTYSRGASFAQSNNPTTGTCYTISCHGGNNPTPQWGVGTATCVACHNGVVAATNASLRSGGTVTNRDRITSEFGLAWGHKKTGRGAVVDADCIVCHLEGDSQTQKTSGKHADGYIDLRAPDDITAAENQITDMSSATFRFVQFATSYAPGSRTSTGNTSNDVDNVLTQKFCLACHDANGANSTRARVGANTAFMPWGGSTGYTTANGAAAANGLINVNAQFATTNSAYHPVVGPLNRDLPIATRLNAPYNNQVAGRVAAGAVKSLSVVINCFDCHTSGTSLTNRTIVAHGNASTLRGTIYVSGPTLCTSCHAGYTLTANHGSGSAMNGSSDGSEGFNTNCHYCHGSNTSTARPARPLGAQDYHGNNALVSGGLWPTINARPVAFIRGWSGTAYHRGAALAGASGYAVGAATCGAGTCPSGGQVGNGSNRTYTPGGQY